MVYQGGRDPIFFYFEIKIHSITKWKRPIPKTYEEAKTYYLIDNDEAKNDYNQKNFKKSLKNYRNLLKYLLDMPFPREAKGWMNEEELKLKSNISLCLNHLKEYRHSIKEIDEVRFLFKKGL